MKGLNDANPHPVILIEIAHLLSRKVHFLVVGRTVKVKGILIIPDFRQNEMSTGYLVG